MEDDLAHQADEKSNLKLMAHAVPHRPVSGSGGRAQALDRIKPDLPVRCRYGLLKIPHRQALSQIGIPAVITRHGITRLTDARQTWVDRAPAQPITRGCHGWMPWMVKPRSGREGA